MSGVSKQANGQASGPELQSVFLVVFAHSVLAVSLLLFAGLFSISVWFGCHMASRSSFYCGIMALWHPCHLSIVASWHCGIMASMSSLYCGIMALWHPDLLSIVA